MVSLKFWSKCHREQPLLGENSRVAGTQPVVHRTKAPGEIRGRIGQVEISRSRVAPGSLPWGRELRNSSEALRDICLDLPRRLSQSSGECC
jgi:hypothetical protein